MLHTWLSSQMSLATNDTKETKVQIHRPIAHFSKSKCPEGPPSLSSWSEENLKTGELFLLSSHPNPQKSVSSYQLLHPDIHAGQKSWEKLPCQGEFSYMPLYWEWLEDVLTCYKDLLVANHLFDALYASLFIYDKCPNIVRVICEYWCPETNSLHTSRGEVSISLLDIYGFLGLPLLGFLYDEVVPSSKELKSIYHILRQRFDHKPTIEEWIAFWFRGPVKYYAPMQSDRRSRVPLPNIMSPATEDHGWNESHVVFDELGVPKGERTETFLAAFLSCWLCLFALPIRDAGCIHPGTFSVASSMEGGQAYCLPSAILTSIYRGLGEICRSAHPGRKGGHIPWHFLYAWVAKYFRTYDFDDGVSANLRMPKFSDFGRAKTFDLDEARELISSGRGFYWNSAIRHRLKATLVDNGQLSRADFAYFASIRSSYVYCRCEDSFVQQTIWLSSGHSCGHRFLHPPEFKDHASTPSSLYTLWDQFSRVFSWSMPFSGEEIHSSLPRVVVQNVPHFIRFSFWRELKEEESQNEVPSGSRPKFKIIRSQKPLRSPALETGDNTSQTEIPGVGAALSVAPISAVPIQSVPMAPEVSDEVRLTLEPLPVTACRRKLKSIIVCLLDEQGMPNVGGSKLDYEKTVFPPPDGAENIMDILDCVPSPPACMVESGDMNFKEKLAYVPLPSGSHCFPSIEHLSSLGQDFLSDDDEAESTPKVDAPQVLPPPRLSRATPDVSVFIVDVVIREVNKSGARMTGQVILDKVLRIPFERLYCLKGEFDSLYDLIHERGGDATPLKNKVERLVHKACDLKDLQESYSDRMTIEVRESRRVEVGSKLDAASHQLDTEIARYNVLKAKLGEVDSSIIDWKGQIDSLNAIEVIDPATKASLEKTEAYVKESFEDL
ncbi:hypothetical protein Cgig2_016233 [Carnegiea gigantea]|uniref:Aminotransferase-like plant mobile domain-containing protein n=1 Tax=Carnegiea gigantea TaxID=171969 RepID=A0A9Q1GTR5_9CARY|nr:hypothetical protein Cgig2_016233 [Carnegiea gigantea]